MANIWRNRIWARTKTYIQCPDRYKADVLALMHEDVEEGKHTAEEYELLTGEIYEG